MIHAGDCLDILPTLDANSVDAVVTDPPYGLSFMGKDWDHGIPGVEFWKAAMRVMKPGAFLLSFGGTRTFHRLTCAIEDAGLEIRDCMMWLYGSGFPKSHDVSKAIDKAAGAKGEVIEQRERGVVYGMSKSRVIQGARPTVTESDGAIRAPSTDAARQWSGWGTALKPAWEPIIVARKPLEGTVAQNVLKWGTGGMNIDGSRIGGPVPPTGSGPSHKYGWADCEKEKFWPGSSGRWPANVILDEEAGAMLDGQTGITKGGGKTKSQTGSTGLFGLGGQVNVDYPDTGGASRFFYCAKASKRERNAGLEGMPEVEFQTGCGGDFPTDDKGKDRDRFKTKAQNFHPTVKPISLLTYLAKLVCPPGGVILDPFMGSGSMAVAAKNLGFEFVGIEREEKYCEIAKARLGLVAA